jgi:hypothetical protein
MCVESGVAYADGVNGARLHQRNQGWSSSVKLNAEGSLALRSLAYSTADDGSTLLYATVNTSSNYVAAQLNSKRLKSPGSSFVSLYGMQSFSAPLRNPFTIVFQNRVYYGWQTLGIQQLVLCGNGYTKPQLARGWSLPPYL